MEASSPPYSLLVTKDGSESKLLAKDKTFEDLIPGKIAVFDQATNKTIASDATGVKDIYIAAGLGEGDTFENYYKSAGQYIQLENVTQYSKTEYSAGTDQKFKLELKRASFNTDYTVGVVCRNAEVLRRQGFNLFSKFYSYTTGKPVEGKRVDINEIILDFYENMILDENDYFTVDIFKADNTKIAVAGNKSIAVVAREYLEEKRDDNLNPEEDYTLMYLKIKAKAQEEEESLNINLNYYKPRRVKLEILLKDGFHSDKVGKVTQETELKYPEGKGYDILQKEYHASGWNGEPGPYKVHPSIGVSKNNFNYQADVEKKYDQLFLGYTHRYGNSSSDTHNNLTTILACERGNGDEKTTFTALITLLDALLTPFNIKGLT